MAEFIANSQVYNITTENEVAVILSHFSSDYIFNVLKDNLNKRFDFNSIGSPNIVASFEQNFKQCKSIYLSDVDNIERVRVETYKEIIEILCNKYDLIFNEPDTDVNNDFYYSAAFYLYDFLVANYTNYLVSFFANYIIRRKDDLYTTFNMDAFKKNKDSSTLYNKKMHKDQKIAILNANIEYVLRGIAELKLINLYEIFRYTYSDINIMNFMTNLVDHKMNFNKNFYFDIFNNEMLPVIITNIRLLILKLSETVDTVQQS